MDTSRPIRLKTISAFDAAIGTFHLSRAFDFVYLNHPMNKINEFSQGFLAQKDNIHYNLLLQKASASVVFSSGGLEKQAIFSLLEARNGFEAKYGR